MPEHFVLVVSELPGMMALDRRCMSKKPDNSTADESVPRQEADLESDWPRIARILDANANRAEEGLRVLEDCFRFGRDDPFLSGQLKQLRHQLAEALQHFPRSDFLLARDTRGDVGTTIIARGEYDRSSLSEIIEANMHRVQQSLRCLEEYSKLVSSTTASQIEQLRYESYDLHRALTTSERGRQRLADSRLHVILDAAESDQELGRRWKALLAAGIDMIQLRDKQMEDRVLLGRAEVIRGMLDRQRETRSRVPLFIINDRPDIARLCGADGVQLGQDDMAVSEARKIVGMTALIGVSTHTIDQARKAVLDGADYIGCGPTFPGQTKQFDAFPGPAFLEQVSAEIRLPAFAIGGITLENLDEVLETGMQRVAVSGAVARSDAPADAARRFQERLSAAGSWKQE
ncbi:MAG: thiamine phosphate synthase [Pirellulaceae bacterium]